MRARLRRIARSWGAATGTLRSRSALTRIPPFLSGCRFKYPPNPPSRDGSVGTAEDASTGRISTMARLMPSLELVETALRHGQQSLLLSRLRRRHLIPVAALLDRCGFASLDVFGGATFEACLRFLGEDPFERLRALKQAAPSTPLLALVRGQALVGHRQMADDVVDAFVRTSAEAGVDIFRCYNSLNDARNLERIVSAVHAAGRRAEGALVYTESPVHDVARFIALGERLRDLGYDGLCIYDPAGLLGAGTAHALVRGLIERTGLPVNVHSAALTGQAGLTYLAAAEAGASSLDVALAPVAGGSSLPATEGVIHALVGTDQETGCDLDTVAAATGLLEELMGLYRAFADPAAWRLDTSVLRTQLPPTAVDHLHAELRDRDAMSRLGEVQLEIPRVRTELGFPPLITPIAQIVATQAVYNVCDGERYATISQEVKDYCLGLYGEPPGRVDPGVRRVVNGREEPITCRAADLLEPQMATAPPGDGARRDPGPRRRRRRRLRALPRRDRGAAPRRRRSRSCSATSLSPSPSRSGSSPPPPRSRPPRPPRRRTRGRSSRSASSPSRSTASATR